MSSEPAQGVTLQGQRPLCSWEEKWCSSVHSVPLEEKVVSLEPNMGRTGRTTTIDSLRDTPKIPPSIRAPAKPGRREAGIPRRREAGIPRRARHESSIRGDAKPEFRGDPAAKQSSPAQIARGGGDKGRSARPIHLWADPLALTGWTGAEDNDFVCRLRGYR